MIRKTKKKSSNTKVRNATKTVVNGIEFKSKLEAFCYRKLLEAGITPHYESQRFTLIEPFVFEGEKVRAMTYTPDFVDEDFIIECKGFANDAFPLRWKLFKHYLFRNEIKIDLYLVRNQKQIMEMIEIIKNKRDESKIS